MASARPEPVTAERIERALAVVAYIIQRDDEGEVYMPIFERLEAELELARRRRSPRERARALLETYAAERRNFVQTNGPTALNIPSLAFRSTS